LLLFSRVSNVDFCPMFDCGPIDFNQSPNYTKSTLRLNVRRMKQFERDCAFAPSNVPCDKTDRVKNLYASRITCCNNIGFLNHKLMMLLFSHSQLEPCAGQVKTRAGCACFRNCGTGAGTGIAVCAGAGRVVFGAGASWEFLCAGTEYWAKAHQLTQLKNRKTRGCTVLKLSASIALRTVGLQQLLHYDVTTHCCETLAQTLAMLWAIDNFQCYLRSRWEIIQPSSSSKWIRQGFRYS